MPVYQIKERHTITIKSSASRVFKAIKDVTPAEVPLLRFLFGIRSLPARLTGKGVGRVAPTQPVFEQFLSTGFLLLAEEAEKELVMGTVGQFWRIRGGDLAHIRSPEEFKEFSQPGYAKAVMSVHVESKPDGSSVELSTETRICVSDVASRRKFRTYWLIIRPGSGLIRRALLRAIKKRAEGV